MDLKEIIASLAALTKAVENLKCTPSSAPTKNTKQGWVRIPGQGNVAAFEIQRTPVTNAEYKIFVDDTGHAAPSHWVDGAPPAGRELHPVVNVSAFDAEAYCAWLGRKEGCTVRLPSEAEWYLAAAGVEKRTYPWGEEKPDATRANYWETGPHTTTPVGTYPKGATPEGLLDMAGNVWEWTREER